MRMVIGLRGRSLLATIACCLAAGVYAQSQPQSASSSQAAAPRPDPRDFQGMWQGPMGDHGFAAGFSAPPTGGEDGGEAVGLSSLGGPLGELSSALKPEAATRYQRELQLMLKGTTLMSWHVACRPSMPQNLMGDDLGGFEVVQTPTRVLFLFDTDNTYWEVYLDHDHPKNLKPTYLGHSIGHWEGNKLVIDTVGYNGRASVIRGGFPSTQLHTVTRMWKEDGSQQLKYETYVEDPVNLTRSATLPTLFVKWTPDHRIYEEHCTQSPRSENTAGMLFEDFTREEAFPYVNKKN
jgi:hypothetical protein